MRGLLVVGSGYLGTRVAALWHPLRRPVYVTTRSDQKANSLRDLGYRPLLLDLVSDCAWPPLPEVECVLYSVAYQRMSPYSREALHVQGLSRLLDRLPQGVVHFCFIGSTSVYGDHGGAWVQESSACRPGSDAGQVMWQAEQLVHRSQVGDRACIVRLAGLYGPGRIPRVTEISNPQRFLNLIHVDDAAAAVSQLMQLGQWGIYNLSDGHPVTRGEFYREVERQLGPQWFIPEKRPSIPKADRSSRGEDKRIDTEKLRRVLNFHPKYSDYRAGIAAIARERNRPGPQTNEGAAV